MGKFGWSLPPGVTHRMIDEAYGREEPCEICGKWVDDCICPECSVCEAYGDPRCYKEHGLEMTKEQIESKKKFEDEEELRAKQEMEYLKELAEESKTAVETILDKDG